LTIVRADPEPGLLVVARFAHALGRTIRARPRQVELTTAGSLAADFKTAAVAVRAASDLLATHVTPDGRWRTPDSAALEDPAARLAALDEVAALAITLADARPVLIRQSRRAGVRARDSKTALLPDLAAVR
jgi:hypothetical protein